MKTSRVKFSEVVMAFRGNKKQEQRSLLAAMSTLALSMALAFAILPMTALAADSDDAVFLDDGDGDFGPVPVVTAVPPAAKAETKSKAVVAKAAKAVAAKAPKVEKVEPPAAVASVAGADEDELDPLAEKINQELPASTDPTVTSQKNSLAQKQDGKKVEKNANKQAAQKTATKPAAKAVAAKAPTAGAAGRFMTTQENCPMMREPASTGEPMVVVKAAKKIWVEEVDATWVKGFNKAGEPGYISRDCLQ